MIDLVFSSSDEPAEASRVIEPAEASREIEQLRSVLLAPDRELIEDQRSQIEFLRQRIDELEQRLIADIDQAVTPQAVDDMLVPALANSNRPTGELGEALEPEVRHAFHIAARTSRDDMAEAIYPLVGPAVRKMVASMFTLDKENTGRSFRVEQILLIDRETGLMIASTATEQRALEDADVVSGMLDAVCSFVQDAFEAPAGEGLEDLRVGDLSVLVENGPRAALASVVRGAPTSKYRDSAAQVLEDIHCEFAIQLATFDGSLAGFEGIPNVLEQLHSASVTASQNASSKALTVILIGMVVCVFLVSIGVFIGR